MRLALLACALAAVPCGCKGHSPNWVRVDLPLAGEVYGPADPAAEGGHAIAFHGTYVHIAEAKGSSVALRTFREDGRKEREETLLTLEDGTWSLDPERIATSLGEEALDWEAQARIEECIEQGPKKVRTTLSILKRGLARTEQPGWVLAFSAVTKFSCTEGVKVTAALDHIVLFDDEWTQQGEPALVRYGPQPRVHVAMDLEGEPALAWATAETAGVSTPESVSPIPLEEDALDHPPIFEVTSAGLAVLTRPGNTIRVRLLEGSDLDPGIDATINPGSRSLSVAATWAGDRLGVFFGLDRKVGTGSLLQHILVEIFPDGQVSQPTKVYTQQSIGEDTAFTRHLCARFADGRYALAWIADDGYSQDIYLQEVPPGGLEAVKKAWRRDFGEGYRALKGVTLFATPPQYVIHYLTASAHLTYKHNIVLTALPTQR